MDEQRQMADAVRKACIEEALKSYEDAGLRGLCHEGRWEAAVEAMRQINLDTVIQAQTASDDTSSEAQSAK